MSQPPYGAGERTAEPGESASARESILPWLGKPPGPRPDTQTAATAAVREGTNNSIAQRAAGTIANVTATPVGAVGSNAAANGAFSVLGNVASNTPEVPLVGYTVMFLFQGAKRSKHIDQNEDQWWLLPALALLVGFVMWLFIMNGDWFQALGKAVSHAAIGGINAAIDYKTLSPLGILGPGPENAKTQIVGG